MIAPAELKPDLDKYEVLEEIGHGGMATVYRARDRRLGRDVAVKVIHRHLRESTEVAARFVSEARAVAKLRHPNIVEVFDVSDEKEPERYLIVELVRGPTLRKLLSQHKHVPSEVAAGIALEIAAALEHAHEQGVIHRDVKPENVLCELPAEGPSSARDSERNRERGPRVKITDFGIAKLLDAQGVTLTGQVLGSPAHMAPEQIEGGEVSARSDVFGLGVLMYECMVGRLPFEGKNPAQVLRRVLDGSYPRAERERPTVGSRWSAILDRALARESADRWESARAMIDAIQSELALLGFTDTRREIHAFFADPEGYATGYEERIVTRLVELGERAREEGEVQAAAAHFNRALAFRPSDPELLRRVTGLARTARLRRTLRRGAVVLAGSVALFAAAFGVSRALQRYGGSRGAVTEEPRTRGTGAVPIGAEPARRSDPVASAGAVHRSPPQLRPKSWTVPSAAPAGGTREVAINVIGMRGATVEIDGVAKTWFQTTHPLTVGLHTFAFVPNAGEDCCSRATKSIVIPAGEGVFPVSGSVTFNPATLSVSGGPAGTSVSCPTLGVSAQTSPATIKIPMQALTGFGRCSLVPPESSGLSPASKPVTLTAGKTASLTYP